MKIVIDTSALLAVLLDEPEREKLIVETEGYDLIAPNSLHWEIGNALSAMFKKKRINLKQAYSVLNSYSQIPIEFCEVNLFRALEISKTLNIYAYDAYILECARNHKVELITLDDLLKKNAIKLKISIKEI